MSDREFEKTITQLFDQVSAAADEMEFIGKLETRRAAGVRSRCLLLMGAGAIGAAVTTAALIVSDVLTVAALAAVPQQLLTATSSSWIALVTVFAMCGGVAQVLGERS